MVLRDVKYITVEPITLQPMVASTCVSIVESIYSVVIRLECFNAAIFSEF